MLPKCSELYVYESHAYCVARIPQQFVSIATSKYCENEIFLQPRKKLVGVQFHPEKSGDDGLKLLSDFLCMRNILAQYLDSVCSRKKVNWFA